MNPDSAKLMLLDTYGLVYRAFFALPALTTTKGVPISAAYGFTMMLTKIITDEKPTHVIAAFDKGLPAARIAMFPQYKAQRAETPDDLRGQFALVRRILDVYGIPICEIEGEEADDIIATLARKAEAALQPTLIVTGDLDLLQVVDGRTTVLHTRRGISEMARYDVPAVRARYDLEPAQLPDYRGLKGDPSDNLPGIPGVGEKTAIKLIKAAGSLDALIADPSLAGTPKLANLVIEYGEQARKCRDVSVIACDLPVELDWDAALYTPPDATALYPLYRDLEFKTLLGKLEMPKDGPPPDAADQIEGTYTSFVAATDPPDYARLELLMRELAAEPRVAIVLAGDRVGISAVEGKGLSLLAGALAQPGLRSAFDALLERELVLHDSKATLAGLKVAPRFVRDDVMIAAHLLNPSRSFTNLADVASEFLDRSLPAGDAGAYADAVLRLAPALRHQLELREQLALYLDVELPLAHLLDKMERAGIALDPTELSALSKHVDEAVARLQQLIYDFAGETFNIGSTQQLGTILFEKLGIPAGRRNKTGWATGVEVLQSLAREYPICQLVLDYREVVKLKNTYIDVLPTLLDEHGRLHTVLNQTSTATGRLSSTNPNLQNIPVRSDLGRQIRRAFVADAGNVLLAADYSQIELRLMAHLSGDEAMRRAFLEGQDIHDFTARQIFDVGPFGDVTPNQRRMAKAVNFGLLYGMSDFGLAQRLEIPRAEAHAISQAYFERFPSVRAFIERSLEEGRERGYVSTILGRRRYMPDLRSRNYALRGAAEREATNAPLQGSAADLMKLAMVRLDRRIAEEHLDAIVLLQIHDELIFEVPRAQVEHAGAVVRYEMEHALSLSVPIEVTLKSGRTWYDVEPLDVDSLDAAVEAGADA